MSVVEEQKHLINKNNIFINNENYEQQQPELLLRVTWDGIAV